MILKSIKGRFRDEERYREFLSKIDNPENLINDITRNIFAYCDEKSKIKGILAVIYFLR